MRHRSSTAPGPDQLWQTCLNRALENMVGAFAALIVTTVVWPRYAREEFFAAGQAALETAGKLLTLETDAYVHQREGPAGLDQIRDRLKRKPAASQAGLRQR